MLAAAVKVGFSVLMPLDVHAGATYDDAWAVRAADFISSGQWLGPYDYVTLIKNIGFPLFLAAGSKLGIGYLFPTALLYAFACLYFSAALRPLFKHKWPVFALCLILLCNPVSFATDTYQRVYRNSITAAQVLFVFGSYIGIYIRVKDEQGIQVHKLIGWVLVGCVSLSWFWITREDSVWIAPFVAAASVIIIIVLVRSSLRKAVAICLCVAVALPVVCTAATSMIVRMINQEHYGVSVLAEINEGNFSRMIKDLYAIEPKSLPENHRVACPHECLVRAYAASPTLASVKQEVENRFFRWGDYVDSDPGDKEVNGGEFFWVFRLAANDAGRYVSAPEIDAFYGKIADEIETAFANGSLERRATMPSSIMTPWRAEYTQELPAALGEIYMQAASYGDVTAAPFAAQGPSDGIAYFERVTGNRAYVEGESVPACCMIGEALIWIYRVLSPALILCAIVACVISFIRWILIMRGKRGTNSPGVLLMVLVALLLGSFALVCGLAYSRISSFNPIAYYYYGSALYPLISAFSACALFGLLDTLGKTGD